MKKQKLNIMLAMVFVPLFFTFMGMTVYAKEEANTVLSQEEVMKKYKSKTGNAEVDAVFNEYMRATSRIAADENLNEQILSQYERMKGLHGGIYAEDCGGTKEEWDEFSTFERMLWYELYMNPLTYVTYFNIDTIFESYEDFEYMVCRHVQNDLKMDEELLQAYNQLMKWQYQYIVENHAVYNFMTGEDSLGNTLLVDVVTPQKTVKKKSSADSGINVNVVGYSVNHQLQKSKLILGCFITVIFVATIASSYEILVRRRKVEAVVKKAKNARIEV